MSRDRPGRRLGRGGHGGGGAVLLARDRSPRTRPISRKSRHRGPIPVRPRLSPGTEAVVELVRTGGFEAVLTWAIGVESAQPFRVVRLEGPARIVIDVRYRLARRLADVPPESLVARPGPRCLALAGSGFCAAACELKWRRLPAPVTGRKLGAALPRRARGREDLSAICTLLDSSTPCPPRPVTTIFTIAPSTGHRGRRPPERLKRKRRLVGSWTKELPTRCIFFGPPRGSRRGADAESERASAGRTRRARGDRRPEPPVLVVGRGARSHLASSPSTERDRGRGCSRRFSHQPGGRLRRRSTPPRRCHRRPRST